MPARKWISFGGIRNSRDNRRIQILSHDPEERSHQTLLESACVCLRKRPRRGKQSKRLLNSKIGWRIYDEFHPARVRRRRVPAIRNQVNPKTELSEKDEAYWRKQFAALDYKITTAQTEPDILQRELNTGLVQYDPNPATAMKESITRRRINKHRKPSEDKKKELAELKTQRDELEDALRHAGGPAGWGRE